MMTSRRVLGIGKYHLIVRSALPTTAAQDANSVSRYIQEIPFYGLTALSFAAFAYSAYPRLVSWYQRKKRSQDPASRPLLANNGTANSQESDDSPYPEDIRPVSAVFSSYGAVDTPSADAADPTKTVAPLDSTGRFIVVVRSTAERLRVAIEVLFVALLFVTSTTALFTPEIAGEFAGSAGLFAQAVFWGYAFFLVLLRVYFIRIGIAPKVGLWRNSTTLYLFAWSLGLVSVRSAVLHPYTSCSKWFNIVQFFLVSGLFVNNFSAKMGDHPVKLYTTGNLQPSVELVSSLFENISFSWIDPLIWKGYWTSLQAENVWSLRQDDEALRILQAYRSIKTSFGLAGHMGVYFRKYLVISFSWALLNSVFNFGPPFFMKKILEYIEDPTSSPTSVVWLYVLGMLVFGILVNIISGQSLFIGRRICIRIRAIIIGEVYAKALRRKTGVTKENKLGAKDQDEEQEASAKADANKDTSKSGDDKKDESSSDENTQVNQGAIINLMAVDAFKVSEVCGYLHFFVSALFTIVFAIIFLYFILGWSAFAGAGAMAALMPLNYYTSSLFAKYQRELMAVTDERVNKLNELFNSIRIIKYFAWEEKFAANVKDVRSKELYILRKRAIMWAFSSGFWLIAPTSITLLSFGTYTLVQHKTLTAPIAFTSIALFNIIRGPMNQLAGMLNEVLQGKVSVDRVEAFLKEEETSKYEQLENSARGPNSPVIGFEKATFSWMSADASSTNADDFKLRDIDVKFDIGKLNVIIGPTGAGKTSLLLALLGEMELVEGRVFLPTARNRFAAIPDPQTGLADTVAFCAQQAWLLNDTIRNNITFGAEYVQSRYDAVIKACALERDLQILDAGDETEIGEKGITLSGGQKQRVSLARAIYSNSKHLIFDDCLSAVDSHTALAIYENAITGPLCAGRTVILVSHNVALTITQASHVVAMDNGRITGQGTVAELATKGLLTAEELVSATPSSSVTRVTSSANLQNGESSAPSSSLLKAKISKLSVKNEDKDETSSNTSSSTENEEENRKKTDGKLIEEETKQEGNVKMAVYSEYLRSVGGIPFYLLIVACYIAVEWLDIGQSYWIKVWTQSMTGPVQAYVVSFVEKIGRSPSLSASSSSTFAYTNTFLNLANRTEEALSITSSSGPTKPGHSAVYYILIYILITIVFAIVVVSQDFFTFLGEITAARKIFNDLLDSVMGAKIRFFDSTPIGRVMNRFSKDIESIDQDLAPIAMSVFSNLLNAVSVVILISLITPGFLIPGVFVGFLYWAIGSFYLASSRELKRIDSISKSPMFQHFGETLNGVTTIRAYGVSDRCIEQNITKIDSNNRPFFYLWVANRWLSFRIDVAGSLVAFFASAMVVLSVNKIDSGLAGLSLSYAITFSSTVLWIVRYYALLEMNMNSMERIHEYLALESEGPAVIEDSRPPANWPSRGEIEVKDLSLRYAPGLPLVIKNVTFNVGAFNKIGIVGRTGAGKSTIITAFFRFLEAETGSIKIDGVDISTIGLRDLRENLAIIPQDPTLFSGTLRSNLDPFSQYSDEAIFQALRRVQLIKENETEVFEDDEENLNQFKNLESPVTEGGNNLSQGQRQLLCLARSLLKSPKVLMLDEATASIDYKSDAQIQKTIREEFGETTILTIAHRLKSIADYDMILVMDHGCTVEYATPFELLQNKDSIFYSMCEKSGELESLISIAEKASKK